MLLRRMYLGSRRRLANEEPLRVSGGLLGKAANYLPWSLGHCWCFRDTFALHAFESVQSKTTISRYKSVVVREKCAPCDRHRRAAQGFCADALEQCRCAKYVGRRRSGETGCAVPGKVVSRNSQLSWR